MSWEKQEVIRIEVPMKRTGVVMLQWVMINKEQKAEVMILKILKTKFRLVGSRWSLNEKAKVMYSEGLIMFFMSFDTALPE